MAVTNDTVLVEILTSANLSGIESAGAGLAGFSGALMGGTLALGGLVLAGKSMIDISRTHTKAEKDLETAIKDRNAAAKGTGMVDPAAEKELAKANKDVAAATKAHEQAAYQLAILQATVFKKGHKETAADALHLAHVNKELATASQELAAAQTVQANAQAAVKNTVKNSAVELGSAKVGIQNFIQTNRDYISNTDDVTAAYTALIREGVPLNDLNKDMTTILDIAAAENITVAEATNLLQGAEAGRNVGLKKAVGLLLEAIPATATFAEKQKIVRDNIDKVSAAYDGARKNLDPLQVAQYHLSQSWANLATKDGPALIGTLSGIVEFINSELIPSIENTNTQMDTLTKEVEALVHNPSWAQFVRVMFGPGAGDWAQQQIDASNKWLREHGGGPGQAGPPPQGAAFYPGMPTAVQQAQSLGGVGRDRVTNNNSVIINANTQSTPQQIALTVSRQLRQLGAT